VREAINQAIDEEMARDPNVFILGAFVALTAAALLRAGPIID
jgi:pyruvate/2-oxoglutarate/acetoin dehydrogenase E1 component